ncbi:mitochondrial Aminomethyltransferase [Emiliania huxleyi CCMP1516]|uniref:Aminomethyltransferase n=2 Tax=Emiliania huxleyi TaxID=2903 RepID=A0A0D3I9T0_EMIH1|nr:mitochondrial Aminomethyltransferase [Emiliania huxleyi CCMP1516]EOD08015.1 mitochondrial Aminomethyltransferase [Emiliania huxleyi CCMP1516]|eukprot:XP_005760444.1 mitochondrial Aminomethyltransferase [Emiliania huxleyi CCMP1516]
MPAESELRKTPLHAEHLALGAKMGPFGGWDMPIQYPDGIMKSHLFTRAKAGLFDVSHMLGVVVRGADRALPDGSGTLSVLTNEAGGIIDDMIITNAARGPSEKRKRGDHLYMVINAGHEDKDLPHMEAQLSKFDASVETLPNNGILALQGPAAAEVLQALTPVDLSQMPFMSARPMEVAGEQCFVARSGYTGEDGFEIAVPPGGGSQHAVRGLWSTLLEREDVTPVGLGARDSLRLEAGLCLYGERHASSARNDLDDTTSPVEGALAWVIAKRRRAEDGSFCGSDRILAELRDKSRTRARCGFVVDQGAPVREGTALRDESGAEVGIVTSGGFSPCLKKGIGMCYVTPGRNKSGTKLLAEVRGKTQSLTVTKMPFVEQRYYRGP